MPRVSVVMPVRNGAPHLARCLRSIVASAGSSDAVEVVVVDNGSTDQSAAVAARLGARVLSAPGLRVGACRNRGAAEARGDILAFVDADHEVGSGWVEACLRAFEEPSTAGAGYLCRAPEQATWVQRMYDALRARTSSREEVEWLGAGNMAIRREVFSRVGGFDETLEACEDVHLCHAIRLAGFRLVSEPGMDNVHHGDPQRLSDLFFGELWRGRDNLRVSLRGPLSLRALPGVVLPVVMLVCLGLLAAGVLGWRWLGCWPAVVGLTGAVAVASLRAVVIAVRGGVASPLGLAQALLVAGTYEAGRALSIVSGATHRTRVRVRHA